MVPKNAIEEINDRAMEIYWNFFLSDNNISSPYQNHIYVTYSAYIYMWHICDIYVKYITHICDIYVSYITHVCYIYVKCRYLEPICSYLHICHTYVDICDIYVVNSIAYTGQIYVTYMWHIFEKNWLGTYQLRLLYFEVNCYRYTCSTYIYLLISYIFNKYITPFFFIEIIVFWS